MTDFSQYGDKAKDTLSENQDKVSEGLQQAGDFIDEKTGERYSEQIDGVQEKAEGAMSDQLGDDEQGHGEQARGEQGRGEQARGEQARGEQARGEQARGEQAHGEQGHGEQAHGEQGHGERGRGEGEELSQQWEPGRDDPERR